MRKDSFLDAIRWIRPEIFELPGSVHGERMQYASPKGNRCFGCGAEIIKGMKVWRKTVKSTPFCKADCPPQHPSKKMKINNIFPPSIYHYSGDGVNATATSSARISQMRRVAIMTRDVINDSEINPSSRAEVSIALEYLLLAIKKTKEEESVKASSKITPKFKLTAIRMLNVHFRAFLMDEDISPYVKRDLHHALYFMNEAVRESMGGVGRKNRRSKVKA